MKHLLKLAAAIAIVTCSTSSAHAGTLTGTITIVGGVGAIAPAYLNGTTAQISFTPFDELSFGGTGIFSTGLGSAPFSPNSGIEFITFVSTFTIPNTVGQPFSGKTLLSFTYAGSLDTFCVTSVQLGPNGALYFFGTITGGTAASFVLTPDVSGDGGFSATLSIPPVSPTPEPNTLLLFGTGLVGAAGIMMRRRRTQVA